MTDQKTHFTVDADAHVMEPRDLWLKYLPEKFRARAIQISRDDKGYETLLVDGKPLQSVRGRLAALGGIELDPTELLHSNQLVYEDGCPKGSYDAAERLKVLDSENIDVAILYPTLGICWEGQTEDAILAHAYTEAYNRWIVDFCSHDPKRLVPIAHINLRAPELAVQEIRRSHAAGCKGIYLSPDMFARGGKRFDDASLDCVWSTIQELDIPIGFHVVVRDQATTTYFDPLDKSGRPVSLFSFAFLAIDVMAAFTEFLTMGLLERYPRLRLAVLETGANWISAWLDRLDHKFEVMHSQTELTMKPSEYFKRQCVVSADPDESLTAEVVNHIGADYFIWASDYPHIDASMGVVDEIRGRIKALNTEQQRALLGGTAVKFYGL
jgi:uncharacterized protein